SRTNGQFSNVPGSTDVGDNGVARLAVVGYAGATSDNDAGGMHANDRIYHRVGHRRRIDVTRRDGLSLPRIRCLRIPVSVSVAQRFAVPAIEENVPPAFVGPASI